MKFAVDHDADRRFVLTGSSTPLDEPALHPGTGRFSSMVMRTMSLYESGESTGSVSLKGLFDGESVDSCTDLGYDGLVRVLSRGGWPAAVAMDDEPGLVAEDYLESLVEYDMPRMFGLDPDDGARAQKRLETVRTVTERAIQSIARNTAMPTPGSTIMADVNARSELVTAPTFSKYVENLARMYVIENLDAWNPHMRSRVRLRTRAKWHLCDPSLAVAAMGSGSGRLARDVETMGLLFESLCLRDIRVYAQPLRGATYYLADHGGYEVDIIVELRDGRWGAFEVKLGTSEFEKAATNLMALREKVDLSKVGEPLFLAILTGSQFGYTRPDGILVVPVGCLGP